MRTATFAVLLLCLVGISLLLSAVHTFSSLGSAVLLDGSPLPANALTTGRALWIFQIAQFWTDYPAVPAHIGALFGTNSSLIVAALAGLAIWQLRFRRRLPWLLVGLTCLPIGPILYAWVLYALTDNTDRGTAGYGVALSTLSSLYALIICATCCLLQIWTGRSRPGVARTERPAQRISLVAPLYDEPAGVEPIDCPYADHWPVPHVTHGILA